MKPEPRRRRPIYNEAMGRAIKVVRTEQGIERRELAEKAGISYSYLAEIENGNKPPSSQVLLAIAEALGLRPSELHATADSLPDRTMGESRSSLRQANIAASAERAWSGPDRAPPIRVTRHCRLTARRNRQPVPPLIPAGRHRSVGGAVLVGSERPAPHGQ